jgi:hypothetical protein
MESRVKEDPLGLFADRTQIDIHAEMTPPGE